MAQDNKGLYKISLQFHEKSLIKISSKNRSHCLNDIELLLTLMKSALDRIMCINNIGITLANPQQYRDALQLFEESLSIWQRFLSENHSNLRISYANIGRVYLSMSQFDLALAYYHKAEACTAPKNRGVDCGKDDSRYKIIKMLSIVSTHSVVGLTDVCYTSDENHLSNV
ncbi:unnamed protein product [Rotaria magnacalcarata]